MAGRARQKGRARLKPELSQHFIRSASLARSLVALAEIKAADLIVEVGPGNGALTVPLSALASRVIAIEADRTLYKRLSTRFSDSPNITVRPGDFLKFRLPAGPYIFFANIPFARTADIVRKLMLGAAPPRSAYIIMESAAATRFLGQPFGPESALSLMIKARFQVSVLAWLGPGSFSPAPSVNAVMLRFEARDGALFTNPEMRSFDRFTRTVFNSQHSSTSNLLRKLLPRPIVKSLVTELGFPSTISPSDIAFEHWVTVFRLIEREKSSRTGTFRTPVTL